MVGAMFNQVPGHHRLFIQRLTQAGGFAGHVENVDLQFGEVLAEAILKKRGKFFRAESFCAKSFYAHLNHQLIRSGIRALRVLGGEDDFVVEHLNSRSVALIDGLYAVECIDGGL